MTEDTRAYWRGLISASTPEALDEVGHPDMGRAWNAWAYRLRWRRVAEALAGVGVHLRGARIFEAAVGVGFYLERWGSAGAAEIVGVDLSPGAIEALRHRFPDATLEVADLSRLSPPPSDAQGFDLVTAIDVLYHLVDDADAAAAVRTLGMRVRPGGALLLTDKGAGLTSPIREADIVTRRPIAWYAERLAPQGFELIHLQPMFWCMDPPARPPQGLGWYPLARGIWIAMRLALKFWPRNSMLQLSLGRVVGALGYGLDRVGFARLGGVKNLDIAVFRRSR